MNVKLLFFVPLLGLVSCASSKTSVGVGAFSDAIRKVARNDDGSKGLLSPLVYPLGVKTRFGTQTPLVVAVDYTPLARKDAQGEVTNRYLLARTLLGVGPAGFAFGPSFTMQSQKGSGKVLELNNGGSTSDFAVPDSSVSSKIIGVNLAYDFQFGSYILGNEIFWNGFMNKNRWNFAWLVSLQYQFGGASEGGGSTAQ